MEKNKKKRIMMLSLAILLVVSVVGVSYAYFTANLSGGETATTIEVNGGVMSIVYADHNPNIEVNDIIPDNNPAAVKSFTVTGTNSTDLEMGYGVSLVVNENTFSNGAITYRLESTNSGSNGQAATSIVTNKPIKTGAGTYKLGQGYFTNGTGKVHSYELKIYFLETGNLQNEDQGKTFKAHVGITDAPKVACSNQFVPVKVGNSVYAKVEGNDVIVYGTGPMDDDFNWEVDTVLMRLATGYFGNRMFFQVYLGIWLGQSKEDMLAIPQSEVEEYIELFAPDSSLTYQDVIDFINNYDFENCSPEFTEYNLIIEEGITRIGRSSFAASFSSVTLPNSLEEIGEYAFMSNSFTTVTIPNNVRIIGNGAFGGNPLQSLVLGNSVEEIGEQAFNNHKLTTLTIPASVVSIGDKAFYVWEGVNALTSVNVLGPNPQRFNSDWDNLGFYDAPKP